MGQLVELPKATASASGGKPPAGKYELTLIEVEDAGLGKEEYGSKPRACFKYRIESVVTVDDDDEETLAEGFIGKEYWEYVDVDRLTNGNKLGRHVKALTGQKQIPVGYVPDLEALIGQRIKANLAPYTTPTGIESYGLLSGNPVKAARKPKLVVADEDEDEGDVPF